MAQWGYWNEVEQEKIRAKERAMDHLNEALKGVTPSTTALEALSRVVEQEPQDIEDVALLITLAKKV